MKILDYDIKIYKEEKMNLNEFAVKIAKKEKGKEVSIAQIKEIMKLVFTELNKLKPIEIFKILDRY